MSIYTYRLKGRHTPLMLEANRGDGFTGESFLRTGGDGGGFLVALAGMGAYNLGQSEN